MNVSANARQSDQSLVQTIRHRSLGESTFSIEEIQKHVLLLLDEFRWKWLQENILIFVNYRGDNSKLCIKFCTDCICLYNKADILHAASHWCPQPGSQSKFTFGGHLPLPKIKILPEKKTEKNFHLRECSNKL